MNGLLHFQYFSNYNKRLNDQVFVASCQLGNNELSNDKGAFFNSILGTLNHILVGDLLWLNRFLAASENNECYKSLKMLSSFPKPSQLNDILYDDFSELHNARIDLDEIIHQWLHHDMTEAELCSTLSYKNMKGETAARPFSEVLSHLFNHQTHHRGQATTLLSQYGLDVGVTDYLVDVPLTV